MRHIAIAAAVGASSVGAHAQGVEIDPRLEVVQQSAIGISASGNDQTSIEIVPEARIDLPGQFRADIALRIEANAGDSSLGTRQTFADISRPVTLGPDARMEVEEAILAWQGGSARVRIGKQTFAWGVLDGLQVTDRLDPSRRREAIFIDQRPDRISRWGARAEFDGLGLRWDAAAIFDGTADQLAQPGDPFAFSAPRLRGGLPTGAPAPALQINPSNKATYGLRVTRSLGSSDITLLGFHGPETEPVISVASSAVSLDYLERDLLGINWQMGSGAQVWRAEFAWIPNQPVNVLTHALEIERRDRVLGGVGLDWTMRGGLFVNAQLGFDWVQGDALVRPNTDIISTVRLQKAWVNDTLRGGLEIITSLSDGDGTLRPSLSWQVSDSLRIEGGLDLIWGSSNELIGQFDEQDRIWIRLRYSV